MADIERIKRDIATIATRPRSVRAAEIERIIGQLPQFGFKVTSRPTAHGEMTTIPPAKPFTVCKHNPGSSQVKAPYVRDFLNAMIELELYEG